MHYLSPSYCDPPDYLRVRPVTSLVQGPPPTSVGTNHIRRSCARRSRSPEILACVPRAFQQVGEGKWTALPRGRPHRVTAASPEDPRHRSLLVLHELRYQTVFGMNLPGEDEDSDEESERRLPDMAGALRLLLTRLHPKDPAATVGLLLSTPVGHPEQWADCRLGLCSCIVGDS